MPIDSRQPAHPRMRRLRTFCAGQGSHSQSRNLSRVDGGQVGHEGRSEASTPSGLRLVRWKEDLWFTAVSPNRRAVHSIAGQWVSWNEYTCWSAAARLAAGRSFQPCGLASCQWIDVGDAVKMGRGRGGRGVGEEGEWVNIQ